jgi:hypothetical protein
MLSRVPRTVLGTLVSRVRSVSGRHGSCPWSGYAGAGFLTPRSSPVGLDGPMPLHIALVCGGRCRPSPDREPLSAPADRDTRGIVSARLTGPAGKGLLPVLRPPLRGVGRIHGDDGDPRLVCHGGEAGAEFADGHAGDQLPEPALGAVFLAGLLRREVQVLDRDSRDAAGFGPVQQPGEGVADLGVAVLGGARS